MGTAQLSFAEVLWGATGSHVTGRGPYRKQPWPEVCFAHAQPDVLGHFHRKWR